MNTATNPPSSNDDMPAEIDFTGGVRGKFHQAMLPSLQRPITALAPAKYFPKAK